MCLITALTFFVSCVGTVEDKNPPTTKSSDSSKIPLAFDGIFDAIAVGHDKVDVFFFPATGGSGDFTYIITYDGIAAPITAPGEVLRPDYRGLLKYTVTGLEINKLYTFQVQARDNTTEQQSFNTANFKATTFANKTCDFTGIVTAFPLPGSEGLNAIKVTWPLAVQLGTVIFPDEQDPTQYVITVIDADALSPGQMNDTSFGPPNRKIFFADKTARSANVYGLLPGKKYFVQVRCEHKGYFDFGSNPTYRRETNVNYIEVETLSGGSSSLTFNSANFVVQRADGAAGINTLKAIWGSAEGAFDHYRLYYTRNEATQSDPGLDSLIDFNNLPSYSAGSCSSICLPGTANTSRTDCYNASAANRWVDCKKLQFDEVETLFSGLEEKVNYDVKLVVCQDLSCSVNVDSGAPRQMSTDPPMATFAGLSTIEPPRDADELGTIYLKFNPPDFNSGILDGLIVANRQDDGSDKELNASDVTNTTNYVVGYFDYRSAFEIPVNGIDPYDGAANYCFKAYPFIINNDLSLTKLDPTDHQIPVCLPKSDSTNNYIFPPTKEEFPGSFPPSPGSQSVSLTWNHPPKGIYDRYEIFYRNTNGGQTFNLNAAISDWQDNNVMDTYERVVVSRYYTNKTIENLNPCETYSFGMVTYYVGLDGNEYRSESNEAVWSLKPNLLSGSCP